jgi:hypothetical protein
MHRVGLKLGITGKGRANVTNECSLEEFMARFRDKGPYLRQVLDAFFVPQCREFLARLGVPTKVERGGRVFPESDRALDVVGALRNWVRSSGAVIRTGVRVRSVQRSSDGFFELAIPGREALRAKTVILATGGLSYPATGSSGDGLEMAELLGHAIVLPRPALVPLETAGDTASRLQGLSLKNVTAALSVDGRVKASEFGEMLFTHFGLSGPIILTLSREAAMALEQGRSVRIHIDTKPALDPSTLDRRLQRELSLHGRMHAANILTHLLPRKLIPVCCDLTGIDPSTPGHQIRAEQRKALLDRLKDFSLEVRAVRPISEAIVTAGGVDTREVDPRTMESRLMPGLFLAGEILDIDADTGGFNLHAAFATGFLAGASAARAASLIQGEKT